MLITNINIHKILWKSTWTNLIRNFRSQNPWSHASLHLIVVANWSHYRSAPATHKKCKIHERLISPLIIHTKRWLIYFKFISQKKNEEFPRPPTQGRALKIINSCSWGQPSKDEDADGGPRGRGTRWWLIRPLAKPNKKKKIKKDCRQTEAYGGNNYNFISSTSKKKKQERKPLNMYPFLTITSACEIFKTHHTMLVFILTFSTKGNHWSDDNRW